MKRLVLMIISFISLHSFAQKEKVISLIEKGNEHYRKQEMTLAENEYKKALAADPGNETANFNLANALYRQNKQINAAQLLLSMSNQTNNKSLLAKVFYNQGVILSKQKNLEQSIEAYKNALRINANDKEARENLQKALLELKQKKQPEKKENKKQQKPDEQKDKSPSSMDQKEVAQRLKLLEEKEREIQKRVQKDKASSVGASRGKDW